LGLPDKNIRPFMGLPLIAQSILFAKLCPEIDRCIVSTDAPEIADVARQFGAEAPFRRPQELAQDTTPMWPVVKHALAQVEREEGRSYDAVLLLDPTSPARQPSDVTGAMRQLMEMPAADGIVAVSRPEWNPIWLGVIERQGWMVPLIDGGNRYHRRQDVPTVYWINGALYLWRTQFVRASAGLWQATGRHLLYDIPERGAMSIDTPEQFARAEALVKSGLITFAWLNEHDVGACVR
jgi:N-acylneuraminate cytidylyltransferase